MSIFDALMGKNDFKARAPVINTRAGQAAIKSQLTGAGQQANALGYSIAASGRGAGSGLALREAQRRGQQSINTAGAQAGMLSQQLEQSAMQQNSENAMQAQDINAKISQSNAEGLQKLTGAAAQGFAMGMTGGISDERAKQHVQVLGPYQGSTDAELMASGQYGSQTAGHDDGRRVQWAPVDPRQQAEAEHNIAVARERGIQLSQQDIGSLQGSAPSAPPVQPRAPAPPPGQQPAAPAQQGGFAAGLKSFGEALSDERSKTRIMELESTIRGLTSKIGSTPGAGKFAAGAAALGATTGLAAPIVGYPMLRDWAQGGGGGGGRTDHVAPAPLAAHDQVVSAPTEAEALAIARAREAENLRQLQADKAGATEEMARTANERQQLAAMPGSGSREAEIGRVMSDKRSKNVGGASGKVSSYLGPVKPVSYDYKPGILAQGEGDPGRQYGLLAQDLARTPQGASVVERGPDGLLRVQIPQLAMMNTAADAEQQREIDRLKKKVG